MKDVARPWSTEPLGGLVDVLDSRRVPVSARERASRGGNVPYYGAAGQVGWIDAALFDEPLVLLGEDGVQFFDPAKPKAYAIEGRAWVNNHAHVIRADASRLHRRFLLHYLNHFDYRGYANGTTRLKLTQAAMRRIPVPLPPVQEQYRIVEILEDHLSRLDAATAQVQVAKRRADAWLRCVIDREVWRDPTVPGFPVSTLLREPMRNGHSARASKTGEGVRALTLTAVTRRSFANEFTKMTAVDQSRVRSLWLQPDDILVQRSNTSELVGTTARYTGPRNWAIFPDLLIRLRVDGDRVSPAYLEIAMRSERAHRELRRKAKGLAGSMPKIDQAAIGSLTIPVPRSTRQDEVVAGVLQAEESHAGVCHGVDVARERAENLKRSLLMAAFSGRLTGAASDVDRIEEMAGV